MRSARRIHGRQHRSSRSTGAPAPMTPRQAGARGRARAAIGAAPNRSSSHVHHHNRVLRSNCHQPTLVFLKPFERVYAPLTAGLLSPISADARIRDEKRSELDRLYHRVIDDLDALVQAVGLKAA
jgi:hypothetical protein